MKAFQSHRGKLAPLDRANVDTDQIIPKQFLKSIRRSGYGESLFFDWRYLPDGRPDPSFEFNRPEFANASILVTRNNFGCGSSREHAVWSLVQYGFRAVLAPRHRAIPAFADIFHNNSVKNGLLNVELDSHEIDQIFDMLSRHPGLEASIDLEEQRVVLHLPEEISFHFDIDPAVKSHLIRGLDEIGLSLQHEADIARFENRHNPQLPQ